MAATGASSERVPPQAIEVEQSVLGAMLLDRDAIARAIEGLNADCFYHGAHRLIYEAIVFLYDRNDPVDLITLTEELKRRKQLEDVGDRTYLMNLLEGTATSANIDYHAKIIQDRATLRQMIQVATKIVGQCYEATGEVDDLLDLAEQEIFAISESRLREGFIHIGDVLPHTFEAIEELHRREGFVTGVPTGFEDLDLRTSGLQPSDLVIVAGRPSMGKTSLALSIAQHVSIKEKVPVAIFSLEMSKEQLAKRMLCAEARVDSHLMRIGRLRDSEWPKLAIAVGPLSEAPLFIDDTPSIGILEMRAKARRLRASQRVGLVIVDYLQLMQGPRGVENRQQEISTISRSLKGLAKELNVPVVALSQLSRQVELRGGAHRPQLSDLRESGAIEQDADLVLLLYRPELYGIREDKKGNSLEGVAEVIIGKQRNGPTGTIRLAFKEEYARFDNLSQAYQGEVPIFDDEFEQ